MKRKIILIAFLLIAFLNVFCIAQFQSNASYITSTITESFDVDKVDENDSYDIVLSGGYIGCWGNCSYGYVQILLNNGSAEFPEFYELFSQTGDGYEGHVAIITDSDMGWLTPDGRKDLAFSKTNVHNNIDYGFNSTPDQVINFSGYLAWGDYNNNGYDDLAIGSQCINVYRNDHGNLIPTPECTLNATNIYQVDFGKIGDNNPYHPDFDYFYDLLAISSGDLFVFISNGSGFSPESDQIIDGSGNGFTDFCLGDINNDCYNDLALVEDIASEVRVKVYLNNQDDSFSQSYTWQYSDPPYEFNQVYISDINYDGWNDLIIGEFEGKVHVFFNTASTPYFNGTPDWTSEYTLPYTKVTELKTADLHGLGGKSILISLSGSFIDYQAIGGVFAFYPEDINPRPAPPKFLTIDTYNGYVRIQWNGNGEQDLQCYKIYRKLVPDPFHPKSMFYYLATTTDEYYIDTEFNPIPGGGATAWYKIVAVDNSGQFSNYSETVSTDGLIQINKPIGSDDQMPQNFSLLDIYPNPFNPETNVPFDLPEDSKVKIEIFDLSGKKITTLLNSFIPKGRRSIVWNGKDDQGNLIASGVYLIHFQATSLETGKVYNQSIKCVLMR